MNERTHAEFTKAETRSCAPFSNRAKCEYLPSLSLGVNPSLSLVVYPSLSLSLCSQVFGEIVSPKKWR